MSIRFSCSSCQAKLRSKPALAGKRVKCPKCGHVVPLPVAPVVPVAVEPQAQPNPDKADAASQKSAMVGSGKNAVPWEVDRLNSDDIPPASHQAEVHRLAKEYLTAFLRFDEQTVPDQVARFQNDAVLGLEVIDEAMVLYKNDAGSWPLSYMGKSVMTEMWRLFSEEIARKRGGRKRQTTTPTLIGGDKRPPGPTVQAPPVAAASQEEQIKADADACERCIADGNNSSSYLEQHHRQRLVTWQQFAEQGMAEAQWLYGDCLLEGVGVARDQAAAVYWFRKAAEQGLALAQMSLANRYYGGEGVGKDLANAIDWFSKAAAQGQPTAISMLKFIRAENEKATPRTEERHELILALRHLHVRCPGKPRTSEEICNGARLMQNESELPQADDAEVASFLAKSHDAKPLPDVLLKMLRMDFPDWPDSALHAMQGITSFGPGGIGEAAVSAQKALQLDRRCKLARQLVKLIAAKQEVRVAIGTNPANAPAVPRILRERLPGSYGKAIFTLETPYASVSGLAFSPDGARLATVSFLWPVVKIWDAATGKKLLDVKDVAAGVSKITFSPDGKRLAGTTTSLTLPPEVMVWDATTGQSLLVLKGHAGEVGWVTFSPDGSRLASCGGEYQKPGEVKIWDAATGLELHTLKGHAGNVACVAFSPDAKRLASSGGNPMEPAEVIVWDAAAGQSPLVLKGHTGNVRGLAFSPDGTQLVSGCADNTVRVWDAATGRELAKFRGPVNDAGYGRVDCLAISPDGKRLAVGSSEDIVKVWDAATGEELLSLRGHTSCIKCVAFSPDGTQLASGSSDDTVKVWDVAETGQAGPGSPNAKAIANLMAAAQRGTEALMQASLGQKLVCDACNHPFLAVLGMQTGGRSTIVCPKCKHVVFTR